MKSRFFHGWPALLLITLGLLMNEKADAGSNNRGVWAWGSTGGTPGYYLDDIIASTNMEMATLQQFKLWGIKHVYGDFVANSVITSEPAEVAAWNTLLYSNGIDSQFLISDDDWGPGDNDFLEDMISFNKNHPVPAQFTGVHLDIETWSGGSPYYPGLTNLANYYQEVRAELNSGGQTNVLVYADQADWLELTSTVNWPSLIVMTNWFVSNFTNLAGITLMDYDEPSYKAITNRVVWQMTTFPGKMRIGLDCGPITTSAEPITWTNLSKFLPVCMEVETNYGNSVGVEFYDFGTFEEMLPPYINLGASPPMGKSGCSLVVQCPPTSNYVVQASSNLVTWQTIKSGTSSSWLTTFTNSTATNNPQLYYRAIP